MIGNTHFEQVLVESLTARHPILGAKLGNRPEDTPIAALETLRQMAVLIGDDLSIYLIQHQHGHMPEGTPVHEGEAHLEDG